jgi:hypothetical protein
LNQEIFDAPLIQLIFAINENIKLLGNCKKQVQADFAAQVAVGDEPVAFSSRQADLARTGLDYDSKLIDINWPQLHGIPPDKGNRQRAVGSSRPVFILTLVDPDIHT